MNGRAVKIKKQALRDTAMEMMLQARMGHVDGFLDVINQREAFVALFPAVARDFPLFEAPRRAA